MSINANGLERSEPIRTSGRRHHRLRHLHARSRRHRQRAGMPARERFKGYDGRRDHRPALLALLHRRGPRAPGLPDGARDRRARRHSSSGRAGGCARTAPASGRMSSSIRSATQRRARSAFAKITRDLTERKKAAGGAAPQRGAVPPAGPGRHRLRHLHARSRRHRHATGTRAPSASRAIAAHEIVGQHFSRFYTRRGPAAGRAAARACRRREREGRFEKEGWRVRKDGSRSGPTSSSIRSATTTASCSASPRSRATSPSDARRSRRWRRRARRCPVAEDGGASAS